MSDISAIDRNFAVKTEIKREGIRFYNVEDAPFKVYGLIRENDRYCRMPQAVADTVSEGVARLNKNTAGGRVRFVTDSPYVAIHYETDWMNRLPHCAFSGLAGFDMYVDGVHAKTFVPPFGATEGYEGVADIPGEGLREITVNFPSYSNVTALYIGLADTAAVQAPKPYINDKPVVYYGSSITQGGCASRPGMIYQNVVSRRFNHDYLNLGFSGSALGEDAMIDYLCGLDMAAFVCDYDHNATPKRLAQTHEKLYKAVRAAHPAIPIILMVRPKHVLSPDEQPRLKTVTTTYENALASGDKNVYLLTNRDLTALCEGEGTVDNTHPNDFGFASMAAAVGDVFAKIYGQ